MMDDIMSGGAILAGGVLFWGFLFWTAIAFAEAQSVQRYEMQTRGGPMDGYKLPVEPLDAFVRANPFYHPFLWLVVHCPRLQLKTAEPWNDL